MSLVSFDHISIAESREPLEELSAFPFLAVPVYFRNGWAPTPEMYARTGLLDKLARVQQKWLTPRGWQWVVYDAWRARTVQAAIFQHYWRKMSREIPLATPDVLERRVRTYVTLPADVARVPPHSTGGAIDLGFWDRDAGRLVPMGSGFDEFCPQAANRYFEASGTDAKVAHRRRELTSWLADEGIESDADEWFHKDWGNQKWAAQQGVALAPYGEVLACSGRAGRLAVTWGSAEAPEQRERRVRGLAAALDLSHPARVCARNIPEVEACLALSA